MNEVWYDNYPDEFDDEEDEFDCGQVDDKRLCLDAGTESCSFFCPHHGWIFEQDVSKLPEPPDDRDIPF